MLFQVILTLLLLAALLLTTRRAKQQAIRRVEAWTWSLVWLGALVIVWQPDTASFLARKVGVGRGADLVVYIAVLLLLILVFRLHVAHDKLERTLTELVRHEALRDITSTKHE